MCTTWGHTANGTRREALGSCARMLVCVPFQSRTRSKPLSQVIRQARLAPSVAQSAEKAEHKRGAVRLSLNRRYAVRAESGCFIDTFNQPSGRRRSTRMTPTDLTAVRNHIASRIVGQQSFIDSMLICLLSGGHLLVEGMPGLAKTSAVKALAESLEGDFHRIQFTPDLLPSDLIGTDIYRHEKGEFEFRQGPLFHNILLADEVNRAPAKVQSALLEAMAERQITVGQRTYPLPPLFMVLATQNPVEQEGTYQLPEAQLDRFLMQAVVTYPSRGEELKILEFDSQQRAHGDPVPCQPLTQADLFAMRRDVAGLYLDPKLNDYVVDLVQATRQPQRYDRDLGRWCRFGASPRASIALARCARARAWLEGDTFVTPDHIQSVAPEILRHRILLTFEAEAEGVTTDTFISRLLTLVAVP
jgi:MoxR-like ATPase